MAGGSPDSLSRSHLSMSPGKAALTPRAGHIGHIPPTLSPQTTLSPSTDERIFCVSMTESAASSTRADKRADSRPTVSPSGTPLLSRLWAGGLGEVPKASQHGTQRGFLRAGIFALLLVLSTIGFVYMSIFMTRPGPQDLGRAMMLFGWGGQAQSEGSLGCAGDSTAATTERAVSLTWESDTRVKKLRGGETPALARFAFYIGAKAGERVAIKRLVQASYHPHNYYVINIDEGESEEEIARLRRWIKNDPVLKLYQNVNLLEVPDAVTYCGPTMTAATLHGMAVALKNSPGWDWFINLSAADYPLISPEDLMNVFAYIPDDVNFLGLVQNSKRWVESRTTRVYYDSVLHTDQREMRLMGRRSVPTRFNIFKGSGWFTVSRSFSEFVIGGWDNLPRLLLLYFASYYISDESYFQTVACNAKQFREFVVPTGLHFVSWKGRNGSHPHVLSDKDWDLFVTSGMPFARKFEKGDPVLDQIDREILGRLPGGFTPGSWCSGEASSGSLPACGGKHAENEETFVPDRAAHRERLLSNIEALLKETNFGAQESCEAFRDKSTSSSDSLATNSMDSEPLES